MSYVGRAGMGYTRGAAGLDWEALPKMVEEGKAGNPRGSCKSGLRLINGSLCGIRPGPPVTGRAV